MVTAATPAGLFHGGTTLLQLVAPGKTARAAIPALTVDDAPRFAWRGIMLDSARHFQSPEFIRRFIDAMAMHKLNVLHWHLTDDQAWRLEIRKHPALTRVGAWRVPAGAAALADIDPATGKPRLYGGFYSQRTVRALVAYAAARAITIVPEIEMPGHALPPSRPPSGVARRRARPPRFPRRGIYPHVYSLEESTFRFLEECWSRWRELFRAATSTSAATTSRRRSGRIGARQALMPRSAATNPARRRKFTQRMARVLGAMARRSAGTRSPSRDGAPAVVMRARYEGARVAATRATTR